MRGIFPRSGQSQMRGIFPRSGQSQMRGTLYAWHMLYVHILPIDMFHDLDDLKVILDA